MCWSDKSKWIWAAVPPTADTYCEFTDAFSYDGGEVSLQISVDTEYVLYVNGVFAGAGQYPDFPYHKVFDSVDITAYCKSGSNTLALVVWYCGDYGVESQTYYAGEAGVRYEVYADGALCAFSDEKTQSRQSRGYRSGEKKVITSQLGLSFHYDAAAEDGWKNGNGSGFSDSACLLISPPLYPRPVKKVTVGERIASVLIKKEQNRFLYDLGREEVGYLTLRVKSEQPQTLRICWGEHIIDGFVRSKIGDRDFSVHLTVPAGETDFTGYLRRLGLRYLEIQAASGLEIAYASVLPCCYPLKVQPRHFDSPLRQKIYDVSVRTLWLCMHDHYEDCPWREQALYTMDSRNQMLCGYYAFGEYPFARASLALIAQDRRKDGLLSICAPSKMNLTIPSFSLHYFTQVYEYVRYSGDLSLAKEVYPKLSEIMDTFLSHIEDGLVPNFPEWYHWNFYEWTTGLFGDRGTGGKTAWDAALNCLLSIALQRFQEICDMLQIPAAYADRAAALNKEINARLFDSARGAYTNRVGTEQYSELVNALAVLCGAATGERAEAICGMLTEKQLTPTSLSMLCFKYDALLLTDKKRYAPYILQDIEEKYSRMLDAGATSFWETEDGAADFGGAGSLCHGWSAMPVYYFHTIG